MKEIFSNRVNGQIVSGELAGLTHCFCHRAAPLVPESACRFQIYAVETVATWARELAPVVTSQADVGAEESRHRSRSGHLSHGTELS
jgi:hypothetical protein